MDPGRVGAREPSWKKIPWAPVLLLKREMGSTAGFTEKATRAGTKSQTSCPSNLALDLGEGQRDRKSLLIPLASHQACVQPEVDAKNSDSSGSNLSLATSWLMAWGLTANLCLSLLVNKMRIMILCLSWDSCEELTKTNRYLEQQQSQIVFS